MKIKIILALFLIGMLLVSCTEDDSEGGGDINDIDMISGIILKDGSGQLYGQLGNPNTFINYTEIDVFPNPAIRVLQIGNNFNRNIEDVWFVKSIPDKEYLNVDFNSLLDEDTYSLSSIKSSATYSFESLSGSRTSFNLEDFDEGYYKVFIRTNEGISWDNIYISKTGIQISELEDFWK